MSLTLPELDDRRYQDLVEEARSLLVTLAPALTNHNPSDPVITLTELFAHFTEILLFRLNYVTDASRTVFLRLLNGPGQQLPASPEELDAEVRRTVLQLRSVDRAVTSEDYELLARAADPEGRIARAHCVPGFDLSQTDAALRIAPAPGTVSVIIVPSSGNQVEPLIPIVAAYLEPRRLLATKVKVVGPRFVSIGVRVTVHLLPNATHSTMQARVIQALRQYLDPTIGRDGNGWPFGRNVNVSEIYRLLDTLPGVDFVTRSKHPDTEALLDELVPQPEFSTRSLRNDANELIGIALDRDELVLPDIQAANITIQRADAVV